MLTESRKNKTTNTHPAVTMFTPELMHDLQDADFCRLCGWSIEFAEMVSRIADWDGHNNSELMGDAA